MSSRAVRSLAVGAMLLAAAPLGAQSPDLDRVEELARLGRTEEARAALLEWWEGARDNSARRDLERGLWLRGRLTVDPSQAELDFQRLVVLYPSSPYAPQALLRLAQAAQAQGDAESAQRHLATLVRDYPGSPSRTEAEAWLRSAGASPTAPEADRSLPVPVPAATPGPDGDDEPSGIRPSSGRPPAAADEILDWFVQFGAFADEGRAFDLQEELVAAGLAARLVRVEGSGFLHVRIGRYGSREDANVQLEEVTRRGFTAAIVRDERAEEVVRR